MSPSVELCSWAGVPGSDLPCAAPRHTCSVATACVQCTVQSPGHKLSELWALAWADRITKLCTASWKLMSKEYLVTVEWIEIACGKGKVVEFLSVGRVSGGRTLEQRCSDKENTLHWDSSGRPGSMIGPVLQRVSDLVCVTFTKLSGVTVAPAGLHYDITFSWGSLGDPDVVAASLFSLWFNLYLLYREINNENCVKKKNTRA